MVGTPPAEQEFVAHLFAPLDGHDTAAARRQITGVWQRCQTQLRMTEPISGLERELPETCGPGPDVVVAARQDVPGDFQVIVRRQHDVLNLSLVFAAPVERRLRIGSAAPPGWHEFARWWRRLAADGTDALLGAALIFQGKVATADPDPRTVADDGRTALPAEPEDAPAWWLGGRRTASGVAAWELTAPSTSARRRFMMLAGPDDDARLSAFTWSDGSTVLPPFGRYLLHAAKMRYQARIRGDGDQLASLDDEIDGALDRLAARLGDASAGRDDGLAGLDAGEARLVGTLADLRRMRRTVDIAFDNMITAHPEPFGGDGSLGEWLRRQLPDDIEYLEATLERARSTRKLVTDRRPGSTPGATSVLRNPPPAVPPSADDRIELRMGFAVDIVGYSSRPGPQKRDVQQRLADLLRNVLGDLGLRLEDTDHQGTGDGMNVFLPGDVELRRALPGLLNGWFQHLALDNGRFRDRMRLRLSTAVGTFGHAAIGFGGDTIIEVSRLLNSDTLREALIGHPQVDLVALVSDQLHAYVVGEGWPGLAPERFERSLVEIKEYAKHAWLWVGP